MKTDGTGYSILHDFTGAEGYNPVGTMALSGSTLFGALSQSAGGNGAIFKMNLDGSGFQIIHSFTNATSPNGAAPYGGLVVSGSTLYGTTEAGGTLNGGTIFKMSLDGSGFSVLRSFNLSSTDGEFAIGDIAIEGNTLWGVTMRGGTSDQGTLYKINTDGTGYGIVNNFTFGSPESGVTVLNGVAYGTTLYGGAQTIYAAPEPGSLTSLAIAGGILMAQRWRRKPKPLRGR